MLGMVWIREGGVVNNGKKLAPKYSQDYFETVC